MAAGETEVLLEDDNKQSRRAGEGKLERKLKDKSKVNHHDLSSQRVCQLIELLRTPQWRLQPALDGVNTLKPNNMSRIPINCVHLLSLPPLALTPAPLACRAAPSSPLVYGV